MNKQKSLINPDKDVIKVIFPSKTRLGQTCSICGLFYFLNELTLDYEHGYICFKCEEMIKNEK